MRIDSPQVRGDQRIGNESGVLRGDASSLEDVLAEAPERIGRNQDFFGRPRIHDVERIAIEGYFVERE